MVGRIGTEVDNPEFAFVVPWGKYVYRHAGKWNIEQPVAKDSIREFLLNAGETSESIKAFFAVGNYPKVFGAALCPGQPPMYEDPLEPGRKMLNTWVRPTLRPTPGPYPRIEAILSWLTQGRAEATQWLKHWMARKVQNPELLPKVAVVLLGRQGSGKGTFGWLMRQMLGPANCAVIERAALESQFNSSWLGKLFVQADEIVSPEHMKSLGEKLKVLITGDELEMEAKGRDRARIPNRTAWLFCSNDRVSPIVLEAGDRRYSVFANHQEIFGTDYDTMIRGCFNADDTATESFAAELSGFYSDLLGLEVDVGMVSKPYVNEQREALILGSERGHESFLREVTEHGFDSVLAEAEAEVGGYYAPGDRATWDFGAEGGVATRVIYAVYRRFCDSRGMKALSLPKFGAALSAQGWRQHSNRVASKPGLRVRSYEVPRSPATDDATGPQLLAAGLASGVQKC